MSNDQVIQVTYRIESELDFKRMVTSLTESGILFTARVYPDSSFPSFAQSRPYGDIVVNQEDELQLRALIEKLTGTQPQRVDQVIRNKQSKRRNVWQTILLGYAIVISIVCLKYWYTNHRSSEDKNHTYEWSYDTQDFISIRKDNGVIVSRSRDANYDMNFESAMSYSREGAPLAQWRDVNEDGFYDEIFFYNLKGEQIGIQYDRDNDGISEEVVMILEDKDTLRLVDMDENGVLEIKKTTK